MCSEKLRKRKILKLKEYTSCAVSRHPCVTKKSLFLEIRQGKLPKVALVCKINKFYQSNLISLMFG